MPARAAGRARIIPLAALLGLGAAACSAFTPTTAPATPTDFAGIVAELAGTGIDVNHVVSGEAGCDDQRLSRTAIGFDARGGDQATPASTSTRSRTSRSTTGCGRRWTPAPART